MSPASGSSNGGTVVTIAGANFDSATAVAFGFAAAISFTVDTPSQITATSPPGSGIIDIRVTTPVGTSETSAADLFTYVPAPTVTSVAPASGPAVGGTSVTINGTNFVGVTALKFGSTDAPFFVVNSPTSITATSPAGTGTVHVMVTTGGGTSATSAADQFTYIPPPTVTNVSPNSGPLGGGTSVTLTGTGFTGATTVNFGPNLGSNVLVLNDTHMTVTAPAGTGTVDIIVFTPTGASAINPSDQFTYVAAPTVTNVSPSSGPLAGGTTVTITGGRLHRRDRS